MCSASQLWTANCAGLGTLALSRNLRVSVGIGSHFIVLWAILLDLLPTGGRAPAVLVAANVVREGCNALTPEASAGRREQHAGRS